MCLSANEPGGPRRCENYMSNVNMKIVALRRNTENQKGLTIRLNDDKDRLDRFTKNFDTVDAKTRAMYEQMIPMLQASIAENGAKLADLQAKEPGLRKSATTALNNHNEEMARRKRMGTVVAETDDGLDESKPYTTIAPSQLDAFKAENALADFHTRERMIPLEQDNGEPHPFITVPVYDVQDAGTNSSIAFTQMPEQQDPDSFGRNRSQNEWNAPTDFVLQAAWQISDGGREYVSQRAAADPEESTGYVVRRAIYSSDGPKAPAGLSDEARDFKKYAQRFPGDNAYAQRVRQIASDPYVSYQDAAVLASAVAGYRRYKDAQTAPRLLKKPGTPPRLSRPSAGRTAPSPSRPAPAARTRTTNRESSAPRKLNAWIGEKGDRIPDTVITVKHLQPVGSSYDSRGTLMIGEDQEGRVVKWFSSREMTNVRKNDTISIRGTVKEQESYKGTRQTVLSGCQYDVLHRAA